MLRPTAACRPLTTPPTARSRLTRPGRPGLKRTAACAAGRWRAHSLSGDRLAIAGYLGKADRFDQAIADFAEAYADQAERDYALLEKAIRQGKVKVETGV